ncbi:dsRBD fold-containing protein [Kitasatospora sp. NPDC056138]|uniref:dsRBD fold-containing protein n=1 Tax=Kitasatospora sp. NPDC056138 TaxID=3345724 RepID=UPI0035DB313F
MSADLDRQPPHSTEWTVRLRLTEEGDLTQAHLVLNTGANIIEAAAEAHRSPHDPPVTVIGDELAAGRALIELGHRLVHAGSVAAEAAESARRRDVE